MGKKNKPFKIVQLTDLHLTPDDAMRRSEINPFGGLIGMNQRFRILLRTPIIQKADLILVTGDITDRGDLDSWRVFWNAIKENKISKKKVRVIPGNHDVCHLGTSRSHMKVKARELSDRAKVARGLQMGGQHTSFPWYEKFFRNKIAVFGLNSNYVGNEHAIDNGLGMFNKNQLSLLDELLKENVKVSSKIVLVHHSPHIIEGEMGRFHLEMTQADRDTLQAICLKNSVKLILHGHLHRNMDRKIKTLKIIGAPASTQPLIGTNTVNIRSFNIGKISNRITPQFNTVDLNLYV